MSYSLLPSLLELGDAVSHNLEFAYRDDTRISYGEETITESNLLALQRRHPNRVRIQTFSKAKEVENGSDWEWMIIGDVLTYRARIQAKRIDKNGNLKGLHRQAKTAAMTQMDALIQGAAAENISALYCFYCTDEHRSVWKSPTDQFQPGCLVADATTIKNLTSQKFLDAESVSVPWHFLFSQDRFNKIDPQARFARAGYGSFLFRSAGISSGKFDALRSSKTDAESHGPERSDPLAVSGKPLGQLLNRRLESAEDLEALTSVTGMERTFQTLIGQVMNIERQGELVPQGLIVIDIREERFLR